MSNHDAPSLLWKRLPTSHNGAVSRDERPFPSDYGTPFQDGGASRDHRCPFTKGQNGGAPRDPTHVALGYGREPGQDGGAHAVPPSVRARITTPTPQTDLKPLLLPTNPSFTSKQPKKSPFPAPKIFQLADPAG